MTKKRLLAGLLTLVMLAGLLPTSALGARMDDEAIALEASSDSADHLAAPVWEDAQAKPLATTLSGVTGLVNVTGQCDIVTKSDSSDKPKTNLYDGDYSTLWGQNSAFPGEVTFNLPADAGKVKSVVLSFEQNKPTWGVTVTLTADGTQVDQQTVASFDNKYTYTFETAQKVSALKVALTSPTNGSATGAFWPALAEAEILTETSSLDLTPFDNLASGMTPTIDNTGANASVLTDGAYDVDIAVQGKATPTGIPTGPDDASFPKVDFDFGENRSVAGFEFAAKPSTDVHYFSYNIYAKADGAAKWTLYASNVRISHESGKNIQEFPLAALTELRYVRFVLHSGRNASGGTDGVVAWPCPSEIKIFGEAKPSTGLIDLAPKATITVPSSQDGKGPDKMTDGDLSSLWVNNGGTWPCEVMFALPGNAKVKRIEINFESFSNRSMKVTLKKALSGITSDMETILEPTQHTMSETLVFTNDSESGEFMSHLQITLDNPLTDGATGAFWPGIAEVKIWAIDETIDLADYTDITTYAGDPTTGSNYKEWDFGSNQQLAGFKVTLVENATAVLKGKLKRSKTWTTYIQTLQSGDNVLDYVTGMSAVRVELSDPAQLTGFQIFGTYTEPAPPDPNNLSFDKPTHSNYNDTGSYLAVDGNTASGWTADMYPVYLDIDLEENYNLSEITVFTPTRGYTQYTVYTSMDGRDFDLVDDHSKNTSPGTDSGDVIALTKEARIVRVYLEYYSASSRPTLNEVKIKGEASGTAVQTAPAVTVTPFKETEYAAAITDQNVYDAVNGIIDRQINQKNPNDVDYREWFTFALADQENGYDYFTLTDESGKIKVTGNNGVSLATGVNHYLKYFCNVHISQVGDQVNMPASIVPINGTVHKETKYPVRYAYNYCTHSYTMSFWNDQEWQNELDWQALNGVNVVLDITGQEEVWREFLMSVGYTHQEAKDFLAGPGYYAWAYMANLTGFGGPIHDSFLTERVELARKNQRFMRVLGMEPVLQAFSGMVPVDLTAHDPNAGVIPQGAWQSFPRPYMLRTDTATYDEYAAKFYEAQKRVFGDAKYYATDPFHEGGKRPTDLTDVAISSALLDSLIEFDSDAVWVIQSWQGNPSSGLLAGLRGGTDPTRDDRRDHALVLDLWGEHSPHNNGYGEDTDGDGRKEFSDTPWVWCMLNNFGGRMGLHGHLDALQKNIPADANASKHMAGVGMSPEGAQENPVLYDFLFETVWTDNAGEDLPVIDLDQWLKAYVTRRYGAESESAYQAMRIMANTVYKSSLNMAGQGSPESVVNGRPSLAGGKASTWGNGSIGYSKAKLEQALKLLLADYDTLKTSDAYLYDVADVLKQQLSNYAIGAHQAMASAYTVGNTDVFNEASDRFLALIDEVEKVLGTRSEFTFGKWTGGAEKMAENADDFTKRLYLRNAKALVTTWGSIEQGNAGGLKDYSNRQWAGLTNDFYKVRWQKWIDAAKAKLGTTTNDPTLSAEDWFAWEWQYARDGKSYSSEANGLDLKTLADEVLTNYSVLDPLGEKDLDPVNMTVKTGSEHTSQEDDAAVNVLDRDSGSIWHTEWTPAAPKTNWWIAFDLGSVDNVDGLRYLPRQSNATGRIIGYDVFVSTDADAWNALANGAAWTDPADETQWKKVVSAGSWANDANWKEASFPATLARYVVLHATASSHTYCSAAELRVTVAPSFSVTVDDAIQNGTVTVRRLVDGEPTELENGKAIAGAQLLVTGVPEGDRALTGVTVVRDGDAPEGVTDAEITVTSQELEGGAHSFTFTMPAYPVTVSGAFKTKVSKPTVTAENNVFRVGRTLTATIGGSETVDYQWYRHEAGHEPVMIQGETASTYVLAAADAGKTVFVKVTGTGSYAGWAQSDETAAILPAVVEVPENGITFTRANGITMWLNDHSGETTGPVVGATTTVSANVTGTPTKPLTVTWESSATDVAAIEAIPDATNGNLTATLTAKKAGNATITVKMTAKDGTVERSATLPVTVKANITGITVKNGNDAVTELYLYANSNEELTAINGDSGAKTNHAVLTAELTEPTGGASAEEKKLDWTRSDTDNVLINFSLSDDTLTYTVDPVSKANTTQGNAKVGVKTITVSSQAKPTVNTSFKIYVVRHLVNDVTVTGTAQMGQELTAGIQRLNIPTDKQSGLTYKWFRLDSADAVAGDEVGTAASYTVQAADVGKYIKLEVTAAVNESAGFFYEGVKTVVTGQVAKMAGPAAPINLVGVHPTDASTNDGKITGLDSAVKYEYKVKTDSVWTAVDAGATQITGLSGDTTYEVRVQVEDANAQEPGTAVEIRVPAYNENHKAITITAPEHGTVATVPSGSAAPGSTVTVTATPADGYVVDTITVTDAEDGPVTVRENQFTMPDKDVTVTVTFRPTQITIHHILENMTCSLAEEEAAAGANSHRVTYGEDPQITLIANTGYQLPNTLYDQVAGTGIFTDQEGTQRYNHYTFNEKTGLISFNENYFPTQDLWIKAKATKLTYNVAYTAQSGYTAPDGDRNVDYNGTYSVTITPNSGYRMPASITVKMKDAEGTYQTLETDAYTYTPNADKTSADISIPNIVGDVQITIVCEEIAYAITGVTVTITHNDTATVEQDIPHVGDVLHANVTHEAPEGTPVTATYQWYRGTTPISGATVSSHKVTADDLGQALKVVVTGAKPFSGEQTSAATNQVKARVIHVDSVTVSPATSTLIVGKTLELTATVTPSDATNQKITWSSDDDTIASVSDAGLVTAHAAGSTVIRATTEDGGKTSTCAITVEAAPARGVVLTGSAQVGETLTAEVFPAGIAHTMKWVRVAADGTETELTVVGSEYTLAEADQGSKLKVVVTIEEQEYTAVSETVIAAPVVLKPAITLSASPASLPNAGGNVTLTVTVPTEITNGVVAVTCDVDSIVIAEGAEDGVYTVTLPGGAATYTFTANLAAGILNNGTAYDSAEATCTVRVASRPTSTGGGTSSGSSTITETKEDGTKVTTETKPDGTKVTTETKPDGTKVTTETKPDGTKVETTETPDGTVAVVETKPDGSKTQTVEQADGTKSEMEVTKDGDVTITVTDENGEELVKAEIPATIPEPETKFEDVTEAAPWAEEAIDKMAGLKLVEGTGGNKYSPVAPMTRGSLATVLHRLSQGKTDYEVTFKDVAEGKYYTEGVVWAAKANVVKGVSEDVFAPDQTITREQLAVMLCRYAKLVGLNTKADAKTLESFTDGENTGAWAVDGMAWCVQSGILKGKGQNNLDPTADVTRAEVAVMLDRFIALLK